MKNSIDKLKYTIEKINRTSAARGLTAPPPGMIFETQPYGKIGVCCYTDTAGVKQCIATTKEICDKPKNRNGYDGKFHPNQTCDRLDVRTCGPDGG